MKKKIDDLTVLVNANGITVEVINKLRGIFRSEFNGKEAIGVVYIESLGKLTTAILNQNSKDKPHDEVFTILASFSKNTAVFTKVLLSRITDNLTFDPEIREVVKAYFAVFLDDKYIDKLLAVYPKKRFEIFSTLLESVSFVIEDVNYYKVMYEKNPDKKEVIDLNTKLGSVIQKNADKNIDALSKTSGQDYVNNNLRMFNFHCITSRNLINTVPILSKNELARVIPHFFEITNQFISVIQKIYEQAQANNVNKEFTQDKIIKITFALNMSVLTNEIRHKLGLPLYNIDSIVNEIEKTDKNLANDLRDLRKEFETYPVAKNLNQVFSNEVLKIQPENNSFLVSVGSYVPSDNTIDYSSFRKPYSEETNIQLKKLLANCFLELRNENTSLARATELLAQYNISYVVYILGTIFADYPIKKPALTVPEFGKSADEVYTGMMGFLGEVKENLNTPEQTIETQKVLISTLEKYHVMLLNLFLSSNYTEDSRNKAIDVYNKRINAIVELVRVQAGTLSIAGLSLGKYDSMLTNNIIILQIAKNERNKSVKDIIEQNFATFNARKDERLATKGSKRNYRLEISTLIAATLGDAKKLQNVTSFIEAIKNNLSSQDLDIFIYVLKAVLLENKNFVSFFLNPSNENKEKALSISITDKESFFAFRNLLANVINLEFALNVAFPNDEADRNFDSVNECLQYYLQNFIFPSKPMQIVELKNLLRGLDKNTRKNMVEKKLEPYYNLININSKIPEYKAEDFDQFMLEVLECSKAFGKDITILQAIEVLVFFDNYYHFFLYNTRSSDILEVTPKMKSDVIDVVVQAIAKKIANNPDNYENIIDLIHASKISVSSKKEIIKGLVGTKEVKTNPGRNIKYNLEYVSMFNGLDHKEGILKEVESALIELKTCKNFKLVPSFWAGLVFNLGRMVLDNNLYLSNSNAKPMRISEITAINQHILEIIEHCQHKPIPVKKSYGTSETKYKKLLEVIPRASPETAINLLYNILSEFLHLTIKENTRDILSNDADINATLAILTGSPSSSKSSNSNSNERKKQISRADIAPKKADQAKKQEEKAKQEKERQEEERNKQRERDLARKAALEEAEAQKQLARQQQELERQQREEAKKRQKAVEKQRKQEEQRQFLQEQEKVAALREAEEKVAKALALKLELEEQQRQEEQRKLLEDQEKAAALKLVEEKAKVIPENLFIAMESTEVELRRVFNKGKREYSDCLLLYNGMIESSKKIIYYAKISDKDPTHSIKLLAMMDLYYYSNLKMKLDGKNIELMPLLKDIILNIEFINYINERVFEKLIRGARFINSNPENKNEFEKSYRKLMEIYLENKSQKLNASSSNPEIAEYVTQVLEMMKFTENGKERFNPTMCSVSLACIHRLTNEKIESRDESLLANFDLFYVKYMQYVASEDFGHGLETQIKMMLWLNEHFSCVNNVDGYSASLIELYNLYRLSHNDVQQKYLKKLLYNLYVDVYENAPDSQIKSKIMDITGVKPTLSVVEPIMQVVAYTQVKK